MNSEQIKDIVIAAINANLVHRYQTEEETAEQIAKMIKILMVEINA